MRLWIGLAFATCLLALGCGPSRSGKQFEFSTLRQFKVNETTMADVKARMGEPQSVTPGDAGVETWGYHFTEAHLKYGVMRSYQRSAILSFLNGTLIDYQWSLYQAESEGGLFKKSEAGREFDLAEVEALEKGTATPDQVKAKFGEPQNHVWRHDGTEIWVYVYVLGDMTQSATLTFKNGVLSDLETDKKEG